MDLTTEQINALIKLQQTALDIAKQRKAFDALPYKQQIAEFRKKRVAIKDKLIDMQALKQETESKSSALDAEDRKLAAKQADAQACIESARGDYRSIAAHSKDIEGAAKRREAIAEEMLALSDKSDQINILIEQAANALKSLDGKEAQALASYKAEGGALALSVKTLEASRAELIERIPSQLLSSYERIAKGKCGVAVSFLVNGSCSACRSTIEPARVVQMKRSGRLAACPHCGRLIVIA